MDIVTFNFKLTNEVKNTVCELIKQWDADPKRINLGLDAVEIATEFGHSIKILYSAENIIKIDHVYGIVVYTAHGDVIVSNLIVEKDKQGYGKLLMQSVGEVAEFYGEHILLQSVESAIGFYEKLGFKLKNEKISLYELTYDDLPKLLERELA